MSKASIGIFSILETIINRNRTSVIAKHKLANRAGDLFKEATQKEIVKAFLTLHYRINKIASSTVPVYEIDSVIGSVDNEELDSFIHSIIPVYERFFATHFFAEKKASEDSSTQNNGLEEPTVDSDNAMTSGSQALASLV